MNPCKFDANVRRIVETLNRHGVDYIMIGGVAGQLHGSTRPTKDVDVVADNSASNLERLGAALQDLNARILGAPELPEAVTRAQLHPGALAQRQFGNWTTDAGDLDTALFVGTPDNPITYETLQAHAIQAEHQGVPFIVASLNDIIRAKEIAGRDKDLAALPELRQLHDAQQAQRTAQQGQAAIGTTNASPPSHNYSQQVDTGPTDFCE